MKPFIFELIDAPYLARPNLRGIDVEATAKKILQYRRGRSTKSYDGNFNQIGAMVTGRASLEQFRAEFAGLQDDGWRAQVVEVCDRLFDVFGSAESRWYPADRKRRILHDRMLYKHAIRGVWVRDGRATATVINARKTLHLGDFDRAFVARGVYEFYIIDDPNIHDFNLIDLGATPKTDDRVTRVYTPDQVDLMPLEAFEVTLRKFIAAVERAGFSTQPGDGQSITDLFRPKKG